MTVSMSPKIKAESKKPNIRTLPLIDKTTLSSPNIFNISITKEAKLENSSIKQNAISKVILSCRNRRESGVQGRPQIARKSI